MSRSKPTPVNDDRANVIARSLPEPGPKYSMGAVVTVEGRTGVIIGIAASCEPEIHWTYDVQTAEVAERVAEFDGFDPEYPCTQTYREEEVSDR